MSDFHDACLDGVTSEQFTRVALYKLAQELADKDMAPDPVRVASWLETGKEK